MFLQLHLQSPRNFTLFFLYLQKKTPVHSRPLQIRSIAPRNFELDDGTSFSFIGHVFCFSKESDWG